MAQLVRAPPCHGGGRGFESHSGRLTDYSVFGIIAQLGEHLPYKQRVIGSSPIGPIYADVAQLAEQLICNQQVIGSSPIIGLHQTVNLNDVCWKTVKLHMGGFPSGQRGQTVNLLQFASVVRIHLRPLHI